jgi:DNA mismatch repair protein MutS2
VEILRGATGKSLILLDELGSGTDPLEGAALGTAILDYFRTNDWKAIITTHLGSMKKYAFLHEGVENAAMEFDTESLKPTYRLLMGIPGNSNALAIARRLGVSEEVIVAAEEEISRVEEPTRELISRMEKSSRGVEKERRRAESVRLEVQQDKAEYSRKLAEIDIRRDFLEQEADLEIDRVMRQAREALKPIVDKLKNVPQTHKPMVDELATEVELLLIGTPLGRKREEFARSLRKGDEVRVPKLRGRGKVRKINKSERVLTVVLDGIPTEVGFDDISWIEDSEY